MKIDQNKLVGVAPGTGEFDAVNRSQLPKTYRGQTTASNGNVVYYLTEDGTSTGVALFPNGIYTASLKLNIFDLLAVYVKGTPVLSNNNRTLTIPIKKQILSIGILSFVLPTDGLVVHLEVDGH